ncbi:MAG: hypothetical protein RLZZ76_47 [Candidatus Parcubacteria bacterium]|jgi:hypothetical protein
MLQCYTHSFQGLVKHIGKVYVISIFIYKQRRDFVSALFVVLSMVSKLLFCVQFKTQARLVTNGCKSTVQEQTCAATQKCAKHWSFLGGLQCDIYEARTKNVESCTFLYCSRHFIVK